MNSKLVEYFKKTNNKWSNKLELFFLGKLSAQEVGCPLTSSSLEEKTSFYEALIANLFGLDSALSSDEDLAKLLVKVQERIHLMYDFINYWTYDVEDGRQHFAFIVDKILIGVIDFPKSHQVRSKVSRMLYDNGFSEFRKKHLDFLRSLDVQNSEADANTMNEHNEALKEPIRMSKEFEELVFDELKTEDIISQYVSK